jgi:hypothetical protein
MRFDLSSDLNLPELVSEVIKISSAPPKQPSKKQKDGMNYYTIKTSKIKTMFILAVNSLVPFRQR